MSGLVVLTCADEVIVDTQAFVTDATLQPISQLAHMDAFFASVARPEVQARDRSISEGFADPL
jgi:hypothetical protein